MPRSISATIASRWGWTGSTGRAGGLDPARWATKRDVRTLVVDAPQPGRLTLGTAQRRLLAAESGHSVLVVGPTQSRKTSGFAIPAILEWQGPVVAASVKLVTVVVPASVPFR